MVNETYLDFVGASFSLVAVDMVAAVLEELAACFLGAAFRLAGLISSSSSTTKSLSSSSDTSGDAISKSSSSWRCLDLALFVEARGLAEDLDEMAAFFFGGGFSSSSSLDNIIEDFLRLSFGFFFLLGCESNLTICQREETYGEAFLESSNIIK